MRKLSIEERMTVCNMSIEAGARAGLISPDEKTIDYLFGKRYVPIGEEFTNLAEEWRALATDKDAVYDQTVTIRGEEVEPQVSWGTNPGMCVPVTGSTPDLSQVEHREDVERALEYMGLEEKQPITSIEIDHVFIGSCTNARLSDLEKAAKIVEGKKVSDQIRALIVPGSFSVKMLAEEKGLDKIFKDAGFEWREAGCSMCLGMNEDIVPPGGRCASTSNRNFEGRQGNQARTHLVSPEMAAAAAIEGRFVDVRTY